MRHISVEKTVNGQEYVTNEVSAMCQNLYATHHAKCAKELIADRYVTDMCLLPVTNPTSLPMFATPAETGGTASRISTSTQLRMQMQLPVEEDPKAGRESV